MNEDEGENKEKKQKRIAVSNQRSVLHGVDNITM